VVAQFQGLTLSAFARDAVISVAQGIVDEYGADAVFRKFESLETQRAAEMNARLEGIREQLLMNPSEQATEATAFTEEVHERMFSQRRRGLSD
jgi:hypothetical protein